MGILCAVVFLFYFLFFIFILFFYSLFLFYITVLMSNARCLMLACLLVCFIISLVPLVLFTLCFLILGG